MGGDLIGIHRKKRGIQLPTYGKRWLRLKEKENPET
jgi:hypothetical protein